MTNQMRIHAEPDLQHFHLEYMSALETALKQTKSRNELALRDPLAVF
jgi:hypothetical protein